MGHTPYGYRIEQGKAVVDERQAAQVRQIFDAYIAGTALMPAAKSAGLSMTHTSVKHMLRNRRYLGNEQYPPIIDRAVFDKAGEELVKRAEKLGRTNRIKNHPKPEAGTAFILRSSEKIYEDPFEQAEFIYSQIKEVTDGAG